MCYVITYGNYLLIWVIRIQNEIDLNTMEAECIALYQAMRDVLPFATRQNPLWNKGYNPGMVLETQGRYGGYTIFPITTVTMHMLYRISCPALLC